MIFSKTFNKLVAVITSISLVLLFVPAYAASLTSVSDTLTRTKVSEASSHTIKFTLSGSTSIANTETIILTFPGTSFTMGASLTGVTIADGAGADNAATSASWSAPNLTITASATSIVAAGHVATVKIPTAQITNPSSSGSYVVTIGGNFGDTGNFAIAISAEDQFTVNAAVDPSITFVLNDLAVLLGTLTISSVNTDTTSFTVNTNAPTGYTVTAFEDGNLRNVTLDIDDVSDGAVTKNFEEYGMSTSKAGQTFAQTSGDVNAQAATSITGSPKQCASAAVPVSSDVTTLSLHASVSGTTPAGSFSHTVTVIATGNF